MEIRWGVLTDGPILSTVDQLISAPKLMDALAQSRILLALDGETLLGWLRFGWFWDQIPYINLLYILDPYRRQGIGTGLMDAWEEAMLARGHPLVMTSTRVDEDAQHFYRKRGYRDAGALFLPDEPAELVLLKELAEKQR